MNEGKRFELPVSDQYQLQAEAFGRIIRKKRSPSGALKTPSRT